MWKMEVWVWLQLHPIWLFSFHYSFGRSMYTQTQMIFALVYSYIRYGIRNTWELCAPISNWNTHCVCLFVCSFSFEANSMNWTNEHNKIKEKRKKEDTTEDTPIEMNFNFVVHTFNSLKTEHCVIWNKNSSKCFWYRQNTNELLKDWIWRVWKTKAKEEEEKKCWLHLA